MNIPPNPLLSPNQHTHSFLMSNAPRKIEPTVPILNKPTVFESGKPPLPENLKQCHICDKTWQSDRSDPTEIFYPDKDGVLPLKCPTCNKKGFGGVAYVVETESKQIGRDIKPLPHVVYQPQNLRIHASQKLTDCFYRTILTGKFTISSFQDDKPTCQDENMREYLLKPHRRVEITGTKEAVIGLQNIHKYVQRDRVLILHFKYDEVEVLRSLTNDDLAKNMYESDIQIGMILRRGVQKKFGQTVNTRLDLYITKAIWDKMTPERRNEMKYLQHLTENVLLVLFKAWNKEQKETANHTDHTEKENLPNHDGSAMAIPGSTPQHSIKQIDANKKYYPLCLVAMRDIFKIELIPVTTNMTWGHGPRARKFTKTVWYIPHDNLPSNWDPALYANVKGIPALPDVGVPYGAISYNSFYSDEELDLLEREADATDEAARNHGAYDDLPYTFQSSTRGGRVCRTKFFFGARYLWTKDQMDSPDSHLAGGIRADVADPPRWMKERAAQPLLDCGIIPPRFLNAYAMNIYHDGTEGLGQHYDDKFRFARPIFTLRLYSDSRLAFGSKDFSMTNSLCFLPMPRGCITVLLENGYAADGVKHCIRPCDMGGKSGVVLFRQIHPQHMREARAMFRVESISRWLSTIEGLEEPESYIDLFAREDIGLNSLRHITECDLLRLGIVKMGPRKLILDAIYRLNERLYGLPGGLPYPRPCACTLHQSAYMNSISVLPQPPEEEEVLERGSTSLGAVESPPLPAAANIPPQVHLQQLRTQLPLSPQPSAVVTPQGENSTTPPGHKRIRTSGIQPAILLNDDVLIFENQTDPNPKPAKRLHVTTTEESNPAITHSPPTLSSPPVTPSRANTTEPGILFPHLPPLQSAQFLAQMTSNSTTTVALGPPSNTVEAFPPLLPFTSNTLPPLPRTFGYS